MLRRGRDMPRSRRVGRPRPPGRSELGSPVLADRRPTPRARREQVVGVEIDGRRHEVRILACQPPWVELARRHRTRSKGIAGEATVASEPDAGDGAVRGGGERGRDPSGDLVCVVEAMKMENELNAHRDGVVADIHVTPGSRSPRVTSSASSWTRERRTLLRPVACRRRVPHSHGDDRRALVARGGPRRLVSRTGIA